MTAEQVIIRAAGWVLTAEREPESYQQVETLGADGHHAVMIRVGGLWLTPDERQQFLYTPKYWRLVM